MAKKMLQGLVVVGTIALAGIVITGCASSSSGKQEAVGKGAEKQDKKGFFRSLGAWPPAEIVKTESAELNATAESVNKIYTVCKTIADAQDAAFTKDIACKQYQAFIQGADTGGKKPTDDETKAYLAKLTPEQQGLINTANKNYMALAGDALNPEKLQALVTQNADLVTKVAACAKNPKAYVTATGLAALSQTKTVASCANRMQQQVTTSATCLPVVLEDAYRINKMKKEMDK